MGNDMFIYAIIKLFIFIAILILSYMIWDKRYRNNQGYSIPEGFEKTDEITIDPNDGKRLRVYYNENTGERFYHEET